MNHVEIILQAYDNHGLSIKKLKLGTGFSKRKIKHLIYTSQFIEDCPGYLHGSGKSKIDVYRYTPIEKIYSERKIKKQIKVEENEI